jgi:hypothetical protein
VQYDEFLVQYKQAHYDWSFGRIDTFEAASRIAHLRSEVPSIEPPDKRADAEYQLREFDAEISPESQERMARAIEAIGVASSGEGTVDERIARAEHGIVTVTSIANESDDAAERFAILFMNETLGTLIESLRRGRPADDR